MSSASEVLFYQPLLKTVLAFHRLSIPAFQRGFSWGAPTRYLKAKEYFLEFLANDSAPDLFGFVIVYAKTRPDFENDSNVAVHIADGQHRLVAVVLGALAIQDALKHVVRHAHRGASTRAADILAQHHALLSTLTRSNIEVKLHLGGAPVLLTHFIQDQITRFDELELRRRQIEADHRESMQDVRKIIGTGERLVARKRKLIERRRDLERVRQTKKELESVLAWRSYQLLKETISPPNDQEIGECLSRCEAFLRRMDACRVQMTYLVPRPYGGASFAMVESEACELFVQVNS